MTLIDTLFGYLLAGQFSNFFIAIANQYVPYGLFFWFVGIILFSTIHYSTKNMAAAALVASLFFVVLGSSGYVESAFAKLAMKYFGLLLGVVVGVYLYRAKG